jgi:hypothetical protein
MSIHASTSPPESCKSCGNHFHGNFCNQCGEKVLKPADKTFKIFWRNILRDVSFSNNLFLKSLKLVIVRPGFLSKEYAEGRRVNYARPMQLFFFLNLIYFLFPILQLFNSSLRTQMNLLTHSQLVRNMVRHKLQVSGYSYQGFELMYNDKSTSLAKLLIIVFVLLASLPMSIIYRKRNRFFADHLTLAVEFAVFNLAVNAILLSAFLFLLNKIIRWTQSGFESYLDDFTLTLIFVLTNLYFLVNAGRVFYNQKGYALIIKVLIGLVGLFLTLEVYRLILFLVTFWVLY